MLIRPVNLPPLGQVLAALHRSAVAQPFTGRVTCNIPALAKADPSGCGITIATLDGELYTAGDAETVFSIQSISKVFSLVLSLQRQSTELWSRVGMEPSGQPFNSIMQLEWEQGVPRNPFINAGAIVVADTLVSHFSASRPAFLSFLRKLSGNTQLMVNDEVVVSETQHGSRNAALAHLMKSFGNIEGEVDRVLDHYFYQCSVEMACTDLARSLLFLANGGTQPHSGEIVCSKRDAHSINAILSTSGMYEQSGRFAFSAGLPAKSGIGGGVVAIVPGYGVITAWSPPLNAHGNSARAVWMITQLARQLGLSIY